MGIRKGKHPKRLKITNKLFHDNTSSWPVQHSLSSAAPPHPRVAPAQRLQRQRCQTALQ